MFSDEVKLKLKAERLSHKPTHLTWYSHWDWRPRWVGKMI